MDWLGDDADFERKGDMVLTGAAEPYAESRSRKVSCTGEAQGLSSSGGRSSPSGSGEGENEESSWVLLAGLPNSDGLRRRCAESSVLRRPISIDMLVSPSTSRSATLRGLKYGADEERGAATSKSGSIEAGCTEGNDGLTLFLRDAAGDSGALESRTKRRVRGGESMKTAVMICVDDERGPWERSPAVTGWSPAVSSTLFPWSSCCGLSDLEGLSGITGRSKTAPRP